MPFDNLLHISIQKDWVDYLTPIVVPILGLYIAYRQWRTEEAKLRHELFERRYRQFKAVGDFVRAIIIRNETARDNEATFLSEIAEMRFIFDEETAGYVKKHIWLVASDIDVHRAMNSEWPIEKRANLQKNLDIFEKKTLRYMQLQQPSLSKKLRQDLAACWKKIKNAAD